MTEHYFTQNPQSGSKPRTWRKQIRENLYTFTTDEGVFSKNDIDFGTQLLIEQFEEPEIEGDFLDLGCGYGPIGIVLADLWQGRQVIMADVNERAIALAKTNAEQNNLTNVELVVSDRLSQIENRSFAAIVTNPPIRAGKQVVHTMFEESYHALHAQGELWVVIQKKQGAPSAKTKLTELFTRVDTMARSKGYYIFKAIKI